MAEKKKKIELFKNTDLSQYVIRGSEDDWKSALATGPQGILSVKRSATLSLYLLAENLFLLISGATINVSFLPALLIGLPFRRNLPLPWAF